MYSETCQASTMELFAEIVNVFHPLTMYFRKKAPSYVWQRSEYASNNDTFEGYSACSSSKCKCIKKDLQFI